jgi:Flp pilus assembly protein TadG
MGTMRRGTGRGGRRGGGAGAGAGAGEGGQSLVEFAMVLPLLLVVLFAIVDFGRIYQGHVTLTNAVREGARLGAVGGTSAQIAARVEATAGGLDPAVTAVVPASAGQSVVVEADATVELVTPLGALITKFFRGSLSNSFALSARADMRLE